ncbi:MAG: response regulator [Bryobacteraceae bacterium]
MGQAQQGGVLPGKRILIVDDEAAIRGLLTEYLTGLGFETAIACNGLDALEQVRTFDPDLLIIDLVMPEQEGIETIRTLRTTRKDLKIVAVSGAFAGQFLRTAELLGANAVLPKPLDLQELARLVNQLVA